MTNTNTRKLHEQLAQVISQAIQGGVAPYAAKLILDNLSNQCEMISRQVEQQEAAAQKEAAEKSAKQEEQSND